MGNISVLGIDLAKNSFQLHGIDENSKVVLRKKLSRSKLLAFMANLPACLVGIEACGGSNYWAREFIKLGHEVKMISPQFVKPYVKSNKNDAADAEAIAEAVTRPSMRFVPIKTTQQQDIQSIHRMRSRVIKEKIALMNSIRGILLEYGFAIPQGESHLRKRLPEIMENELSELQRFFLQKSYDELVQKNELIKECQEKIGQIHKQNEACQRLATIPGIGPQCATILFAALGTAKDFKNGREFAAYLGLVPKQFSTGGKQKLQGISKRGDKYIRSVLVHGARSVIWWATNKTDKRSRWVASLLQRKGFNKTVVAVANRNARIVWALLKSGESYKAA